MKKTNNKGFSLVELIVVIAIMAVLIVVVAPQFLKYVERGRNSTDMQNAAAIVTAVQVWAVEPDIPADKKALEAEKSATVTIAANGGSVTGDNAAAVEDALENAGLKLTDIKCVSRTAWKDTDYSLTFTVAKDGTVSVVYDPAEVGGGTTTTPSSDETPDA